ncbi:HD-GYP domain-containing protein [Deinococcus yavapaiensis]|uniref:GAF domain-containing protein n=1 Tax=Deinococcus yavapaiensis KR-236 TaxID=694435 RepID=A0A318S8R3_9DEIO|nr:HD domain-containing phosphohydrolase [Deinococcus yavapaiensis]PYE54915.1 GAF domain-containing protein [Deinococcus yavapaiensis KR-236]
MTLPDAEAPSDRTLLRRTFQSARSLLSRIDGPSDDDYRTLMDLAAALIDGHDAAALFVRERGTFRVRVTSGASAVLIDRRVDAKAFLRWFDARSGRPEGRPRAPLVCRGHDAHSAETLLIAGEDEMPPGTPHVRASLTVPVEVDARITAVLHLENHFDENAFTGEQEQTASEIAEHVGFLLTAAEHRAREAARNRELEMLSALNVALRPARAPGEVEEILVQQTVVLLGTRYATLLRYDPVRDTLVTTASSGQHAPESGLLLRRGEGLSWTAVEARSVTCFQDALRDPRAFVLTPVESLATLYAPLLAASGELLGVLAVGRLDAPFTTAEVRLAEAFASAGATALERALETRAVKETREGALLALGRALEVRDFETRGHTERVVRWAEQLGRAFGLPSGELEALRQGAYLHDIGKLGLPDGVLLKPGVFEEHERRLMQAHTTIGDALARGIPTLPEQARQVVRFHHERWDGAGYPDGLVGEAIPLLARLFAVVDVYDALRSARPYKRAWTHEAAMAEIEREAGRQFDARVVRAFLNLVRTLED